MWVVRPSRIASSSSGRREHDPKVAICPICERSFDEQAYQLVIGGMGAFDSIACAEEAMRRHARRQRGDLATELLDELKRDPASSNGAPEAQRRRLSS
jgi:hypothetical protein